MDHANRQLARRPSWLTTLDWAATVSSMVLLATGILMLLNGRCSRPHGLSANAPMCVGAQLSVQSWLAITGVEFSLLGTVLLPRLASIAISKCSVRALETSGVGLDRLLNSLATAPLLAQLRGSKRVLLLRCLVFALVALVSVLYKFSYVSVDAPGTLAVPNFHDYYGNDYSFDDPSYTAIGGSDIPREYNYALGEGVAGSIFSANLVDFLTVTNGSVIVAGDAGRVFESPTDLIVGPKVNATRLTAVANGTVDSCDPLLYLRSSFYVVRSIGSFGTPQWSEFPLIEPTPYNGGVRIDFTPWNATVFNGGILDITSLSNGSLQAWGAGHLVPQEQGIYDYMITVNMQYCYGYISWTNSVVSGLFQIENPTDIQCQALPFDVVVWNQTKWAYNAKTFIQAACGGDDFDDDDFWKIALPIVAIVQDHSSVQDSFGAPAGSNPRCGSIAQDSFAFAEGVISGSQTGMTALGMALQGLAVVAAVVAAGLILWPRLPLLTEWPAQWLALGLGLDDRLVQDAVEGSVTGNAVRANEVVFLSVATGGSELRLSSVRPR